LKLLEEILNTISYKTDSDLSGIDIAGVAIDSRIVEKDFLFIAYKGTRMDGHSFIDSAVDNGASCVVLDDADYIQSDSDTVYLLVKDARSLVSEIAAAFYNYPSKDLKVVGVTGTNGKTTTVSLLYELFEGLGYNAGLVSTIDNKFRGRKIAAELTTPDAVSLQRLFREMVDAGVSHVFMEVSSHALHQNRVKAVDFDVAVFTNITRDHLDYHGSFKAYIEAKKLLFDNLKPEAFALVNIDDINGGVMVQNSKARKMSYALKRPADFKCKIISNDLSGLHVEINRNEVFLRLVGRFNAYNASAVFGAGRLLGVDETDLLVVLSRLQPAEGRLEIVDTIGSEFKAVVDYAHTPDALDQILETLNDVVSAGGKIISVVGCGGDRDKGKRPEMARIAAGKSTKTIFTSDNPRNEDPEAILDDMINGLSPDQEKNVLRIADRKEAIKMACMLAGKNDVVLVAGKGHEKYQEIKGQRFPFDDKEIIRAFMR